jgi:hypothetical protein
MIAKIRTNTKILFIRINYIIKIMAELAYQNQVEEKTHDNLENQMLESVSNFEIKRLGENLIYYIDEDGESFKTRCKNNGAELDEAYIEDYNFVQTVSNRLRYHLKNDYGFNSEIGFKSFRVSSDGSVSNIGHDGKEIVCFGTRRDKTNASTDLVTIKYSQATRDEPKYVFNGNEYACLEMFEVFKKPKGKLAQRMTMRQYYIDNRQMVTYRLIAEENNINEQTGKKIIDNFSTIKT